MTRLPRLLLLRILPVLLLLELGLRIEWYVRDHRSRPEVRDAGAVRLVTLGNSLTADYPRFLEAEIAERLPAANVVIEPLVRGSTSSAELVRDLDRRLRERSIDVVIAMIGAYDERAVEESEKTEGPLVADDPGSRGSPGWKPMFPEVFREAWEGWVVQMKQRGWRGLLRPDQRAATRPVFQRGPAVARTEEPPVPPKPGSETQPETQPDQKAPEARAESRRAVNSGDPDLVSRRFLEVLATGWESDPDSKEFRTSKQWYRAISRAGPEFAEQVASRIEGRGVPGAELLLRTSLAFGRGQYEDAFRMEPELPPAWFETVSLVQATLASRDEFRRILSAAIRVRGGDALAARMQMANLTRWAATDEAIEFLSRILLRRWPETDPPPGEREALDQLARERLPLLLAARSECARTRQFGFPRELADSLSAACEGRDSAALEAEMYTEMTRESYARLQELSRQHGFGVVAVQYPGRPVDELLAYLPPDHEMRVVDNYASFVQAVEEFTHLGVYTNYGRVGRADGGHMTPLGDRLLARNIFEALLEAGWIPHDGPAD